MVNHFYDERQDVTLCREFSGEYARAISITWGWVSCPECERRLEGESA